MNQINLSNLCKGSHKEHLCHITSYIDSVRVATVREKVLENEKKFQVREKSGNYIFFQGNFEKMKKVR